MRGSRFVRFSVFCLLGCILWVFVLRDYAVFAEDLQEEAEDLGEAVDEYYQEVEEIGSLSLDEENLDSAWYVLSDSFTYLSSLRSSTGTNTYSDFSQYGFADSYYKVNFPASSSYFTYVFTQNAFKLDNDPNFYTGVGRTVEMLRNWIQSLGSSARWQVSEINYNGSYYLVFIVSNYLSSTATQNALVNYLNNNGFPEANNDLYWDDGSGSSNPDPTPTITPTPTPDPDSPVVVGFEYMEQRPDLIVIIFAFGVIIGIFAARMVLRFVK